MNCVPFVPIYSFSRLFVHSLILSFHFVSIVFCVTVNVPFFFIFIEPHRKYSDFILGDGIVFSIAHKYKYANNSCFARSHPTHDHIVYMLFTLFLFYHYLMNFISISVCTTYKFSVV